MRHFAILVSTYRLDLNLVTASEHIVYFSVREPSKLLWFLFFHSNSNHGHRFLWLFAIVTDHWRCSFNTKICFKPFLFFSPLFHSRFSQSSVLFFQLLPNTKIASFCYLRSFCCAFMRAASLSFDTAKCILVPFNKF